MLSQSSATLQPLPRTTRKLPHEVVKARLKAKGKNQQWLAKKIGYSATTVNAYLNGRMPLAPNQFVTVQILLALGLDENDLYSINPSKKK